MAGLVVVEGSRSGVTDDATFDAFYRAEYRGVLAFAASLCRDDDAAQYVTQDAGLPRKTRRLTAGTSQSCRSRLAPTW